MPCLKRNSPFIEPRTPKGLLTYPAQRLCLLTRCQAQDKKEMDFTHYFTLLSNICPCTKHLSVHLKTMEIMSWKNHCWPRFPVNHLRALGTSSKHHLNRVLGSRSLSLILAETSKFQVIKFYYGTTVSGNIYAIILIIRLIWILAFEKMGGFFCLCNLAYECWLCSQ